MVTDCNSTSPQDAGGFSPDQRRFMLWLATPSDVREERTLAAYCKAHDITRMSLWRWKKLPGFWQEVRALTAQFMADSVPDVLQSLKRLAKAGSFPHMKLYLEMVGMYVPRSETTIHNPRPYSGLSDAELEERINQEIEQTIIARKGEDLED